MLSSGMRLSFVFAMKSHLGLLGIIRSVAVQSRIKGIATWGSPGFVDRSQGYAGVSLGAETNCCS
jgi:hypothetical protein